MSAPQDKAQDKAIGLRIPRSESKRLMRGRGRYIGDIVLPRMLHLAFVRSPYAHAKILSLDLERARACENVVSVFPAPSSPGYASR